MSPELAELARIAGIWPEYLDQMEEIRPTDEATARALLRAMGIAAATDAETRESLAARRVEIAARHLPRWLVATPGTPVPLSPKPRAEWVLSLEDGSVSEGRGPELPAMPLGIHELASAGERMIVLCAPPHLPLPAPAWGVTLPLYGLKPGGLGDFDDLGRAMEALAAHGAAFAGINPIHAGFFPNPCEISPYAPSHRRRLNAAYLGNGEPGGAPGDLIDYPDAFRRRWGALKAEFDAGIGRTTAFDAWRRREGVDLERFTTHQALSELHGPFWTDWPEALRSPSTPDTRAFAHAETGRLEFHAWLQFRAEQALAELASRGGGMRFGLYLDIAVGTHPSGAETWAEPDAFAAGVSLGAPPDAFSRDGQVWGLAPIDPHRLVTSSFRPVAEMLRKQLAYSRLLRIDHILGFDRTFWVPEEAGLPGAYVSMPREALLAVVRIEAARAGATVIGEDLGNVPGGLRKALSDAGVLGCRVAMFEFDKSGNPTAPEDYTEAALASFGTHDLPTWAGWRKSRDIDMREKLGSIGEEVATRARAEREEQVRAFDRATHQADDQPTAFLARSRARLVALQIEDILGVEEQPNLPGTVDEYPNWRQRVPLPPGDWAEEPSLIRAAKIMSAAGRQEERWND